LADRSSPTFFGEFDNGALGPEIIVSEAIPNFVRRLFELEVAKSPRQP